MFSKLQSIILIFLCLSLPSDKDAKSIVIPADKATELRTRLTEATDAEKSAELAEQFCQARKWEAEAKRNAWIATQYKIARELKVPLDWILDVETMTFKPRSPEKVPVTSPQQRQGVLKTTHQNGDHTLLRDG